MEPLDRNLQRRVWHRVYETPSQTLTTQQRQALRQCLRRCRENWAVYHQFRNHFIYREAFARLADETAEQIKMLEQILRS